MRSTILCLLAALSIPSGASAQSCAGTPVAVQILGSGGPAVNANRASASYVLWVGDAAKLLVDMGGGTYIRFGQSQAKLADLAMLAISHLHPDHVSDLPALLWLSHQLRKDPLPIVGPSGNEVAPAFPTFLSRLFDEKNGAFQVLGHTVGATQGNGVPLEVSVVDVKKAEPSTVFDRDGFTVTRSESRTPMCLRSLIVCRRGARRSCSAPIRTAPIRSSRSSQREPTYW
jgi:ribonuclease BN (tRNA processing enzyme)